MGGLAVVVIAVAVVAATSAFVLAVMLELRLVCCLHLLGVVVVVSHEAVATGLVLATALLGVGLLPDLCL